MAEYMNKELFLRSMGLVGDETKYGNRDEEHQSRSYSTWMGYEIMDSVEDSVVGEDVVPVVRCKDCKHNPNYKTKKKGWVWCRNLQTEVESNGFCSCGEPKTET